MSQEIKVLSSVEKTAKTGNPYKQLEVFADNENRKVNIFSSAPDFANIRQGSTILGTMSKKGEYWDIAFDGITPRGGAGSSFKAAQIEKVMDVKRQDISKFQDNKEQSIKIASTLRMAVDTVIALGQDGRDGTFQEAVRWWREWYWMEWDKVGSDVMKPF